MKVVGLMSGTSMDGVDGALLELEGGEEGGVPERWELLGFVSRSYDRERRDLLRRAVDHGDPEALCDIHMHLADWFAEAVAELLDATGVRAGEVVAIGSHGHTVRHRPPSDGRRGSTLQLGDPATLAARTGIDVVSDFRAADMAAGGHGAPLVCGPDRLLFSLPGKARALQNLGGIGNLTWLPPAGSDAPGLAFDTGPGNVLMDLAAIHATEGRQRCDVDGGLARRGTPDEALLRELMAHPFFDRPPPRSTGRELFGPGLVDRLARERGLRDGHDEQGWADLLATLTRFTALSVADAVERWVRPRAVDEVVLTGGGARNPELTRRLAEALDPIPVRTGSEALGMDPDAREAAAFAVLAWLHLLGRPGNVPAATGAREPRVLGSRTPAPRAVGAPAPGRGPAARPASDAGGAPPPAGARR